MPVAGLYDHPEFIRATAATRGMICTLCLHYWLTECMPLPTQPARLFIAAGGDPRAWHYHKEVVLRIFNDIQPELDAYFDARERNKTTLHRLAARAKSGRKARALEENAPELVDMENRAPVKRKDRYERVATPEERGARRGFIPKR